METIFPKINIQYNRFLDPIFIGWMRALPKWKNWIPPSKEEVLDRVKVYKEEWSKYEDKVMKGLYEGSGLSFVQNIIDVHIVSGNPRAFSNPIVIKSGFERDEFVRVLIHELIHRLFSNNNKLLNSLGVFRLFKNEDPVVANHIHLDALIKYIYLDVLKNPKWLKKDKEGSGKSSYQGYRIAWSIVEERGYREILEKTKDLILNKSQLS